MFELVQRCFPDRAGTADFQAALRRMIPSTGHSLSIEPDVLRTVRDRNNAVLGLRSA